jgi:adenylate cyclase class IV
MPKEYEYTFQNFNKNKIIAKLKELNGIYKGTFLFRVQQFYPPNGIPFNINIRVRDEEYRVTMTIKLPTEDFDDEYEIIIDDFNNGINWLLSLGYTKMAYYEKVREIYYVKTPDVRPLWNENLWNENLWNENLWNEYSEIVFDTEEGFQEIMEIESPTFEELEKMVKIFDLQNGSGNSNIQKNDINANDYIELLTLMII